MKKLLASLAVFAALSGAALAQPSGGGPGPGPVPNPWVQNGSALSYGGCLTIPSTVTGGCEGNGTINTHGIYVDGVAVVGAVTSVFGRTGVVTAQTGDYGVAQVTGAAPLASPTFTGTVTVPSGAALGTPASLTLTNATGLVPSTGLAATGTPSSTTYLRGDNTWQTISAGGVTSVGQTFTGGLISVSGSPITSSGTLALTVAGTSGGIPYFSSGTTWASSAALAANALVIGGGAGVAPSTTTTASGILTFLGTPSSANFRAAVTDETGTGALVFAGGNVGAATATTPSTADNSTLVATTAYVQAQGYALNGIGAILASNPTLTAAQFNTQCPIYTVNASSLNIAAPAASTLQANGGCLYVSNPSSNTYTITPNGSDTLNGTTGAKTYPANSLTLLTTNGSTALFAPIPPTASGFPITLGSTSVAASSTNTSLTGLSIIAGGSNTLAATSEVLNANVSAAPSPLTGTGLLVSPADGVTGRVQANGYGATARFTTARYDGTLASPTQVLAGDEIGGINAYAFDGTTLQGPIAAFRCYATDNITSAHFGSKCAIATSLTNTTTLTDQFVVDNGGNASLTGALTLAGITGSTQCLHVNSSGLISGTGSDCGSGGSGITIGTTSITSGTDKGLLYDNAGVVGNLATANNGVLITSGTGVPSISSTLPSGIAATNMALTTPAIGVATGTSLALNGCTIGSNALCTTGTANISSTITGGGTITAGAGSFTIGFNGRGVISSPGAGSIQLGAANNTSPVAYTLWFQGGSGSNINAPSTSQIVAAGGTGTGSDADLILFTQTKNGVSGSGSPTANAGITIKAENQVVQINQISSDATHTDATVCEDTTTHGLYAGSGTLGVCLGTSTMRAKENIQDVMDASALLKLRPVSFNYRPGWGYPSEKQYYGFLAEDVEKVLPKLVGHTADGQTLNADYLGMIPLLVKQVQVQQEEITSLRKHIARHK